MHRKAREKGGNVIMTSNNGDKILNVRTNLAVKLNPPFYQLPNEAYLAWFYAEETHEKRI